MTQRNNAIKYENAPISEAVIHVKCNYDDNYISQLKDAFTDELPSEDYERNVIKTSETKFNTEGQPEYTKFSEIGFSFKSKNTPFTFKLNARDGFVVNYTKPYDCWEVFLEETKRFWELTERIANIPDKVQLSTRYINHVILRALLTNHIHID